MAKVYLQGKSFEKAGRTLDPTELAKKITLYANVSTSNGFSSFRDSNAVVGYTVPVGKKLVAFALEGKNDSNSTLVDARLVQGTNDRGINHGSAPDNVVNEYGGTFTAYSLATDTNVHGRDVWPTNFEIPAGRIPHIFATNGSSFWLHCTLEDA
jgi:hypothetical protein